MTTCHDILEEIKELLGEAFEPFTGEATTTHTFAEPMRSFVILNGGSSNLTITINGDTYIVPAGSTFDERFEAFTQVTITTTVPFQAYGRK